MISTSKLQALTRQIGQFDAALANFQTKYNQIPGDTTLMGVVTGDNNGIVNHSGGCGGYGREMAKYWSDLSNSGLLSSAGAAYIDNSNTNSDISVSTATKFPVALAGANAYVMVFGTSAGVNYYYITYAISGNPGAQVQIGSSFKPSEALAFDQKLDDGLANNGNVVGINHAGGFPAANGCPDATKTWVAPVSGNTCATSAGGNIYKVATATNTCSIAVRLGISTGDLK